ncbi:hypothetical protein KJK32_44065 [Streptomyces sp. JCM17656]|nr:hypothetical protein KJK32_44065 [Streptomyces sp. JCM17656]
MGTEACLERGVRRLRDLWPEIVGAWVIVDGQDGVAVRIDPGMGLSDLFTLNDFITSRTHLP